jgi:hypothetical protein
MRNCPLVLGDGCQYGKCIKCPEDYRLCSFYQVDEDSRVKNEFARIQLQAGQLEENFKQMELNLYKEVRSRDV